MSHVSGQPSRLALEFGTHSRWIRKAAADRRLRAGKEVGNWGLKGGGGRPKGTFGPPLIDRIPVR